MIVANKKPIELINIAVSTLTKLDSEKSYDIEIKEHREKRSLDANAYFHILIQKLSTAMHIGFDEMKNQMVISYSNGTYVRMSVGWTPQMFGIKYFREIGEAKGTRVPCTDYIVYKPTHEMNSLEMYNLIQGVRQECVNIGIPEEELMTPDEIAELKGIKEDGVH